MGKPLTVETVRRLALALPRVLEGTSYQAPAFRVDGERICWMQDGLTLVVHCPPERREQLLLASPDVFFTTEPFLPTTWVLVRLEAIGRDQLEQILRAAWRQLTPGRRPRRARAAAR